MINELFFKWADGRLTEKEYVAIGYRLQSILGLKFVSFDPDLKFRLDSGKIQTFSVEFGLNLIQKIGG